MINCVQNVEAIYTKGNIKRNGVIDLLGYDVLSLISSACFLMADIS